MMKELDKIYNCPYKIEGEILTIYNPIYGKMKKKITLWRRVKNLFSKNRKNISNAWDYVTLQNGDSFEMNYTRNYGDYFSFKVNYPTIFWNGKFIKFYNSGPTPTENFRDLRPKCRVCGELKSEGSHADCVEEALEQYN